MHFVAELPGNSHFHHAPAHYLRLWHLPRAASGAGLRYPVWSVLEYLASGMTEEQILADFEDLEAEDLRACQAYAAAIVKKVSQAITGDGTRRPMTKQQMLAHLIETGKVPPGTVLNEQGQIQKPT